MVSFKEAAFAAMCVLALQVTPSLTATNTTLPAPELISLGGGVVGGLHRPAADSDKANLAVFVMHAEEDYL